jgi:predicted DNA-binding transcriptional regulator AlpA
MLTKQDVLDLVGVSAVTLWSWIRQGIFPPAVVIGPEGGHRSTQRWIDYEVQNFLVNAPRRLPGRARSR